MRSIDLEQLRRVGLAVGDWLLVAGCCVLAYRIRFLSGWIPAPRGVPQWSDFLGITALTACVWVWAFHWAGVYSNRYTTSVLDEVYQVLVGIFIGALAIGALSFLLHMFWHSRLVILLTAGLAAVVLPPWHITMRITTDRLSRRAGIRQRLALVGLGEASREVANKLERDDGTHELTGFILTADEAGTAEAPAPILGTLAELPQLVDGHGLDEVWAPSWALASDEAMTLVATGERAGVRVKFVTDSLDLIKHRGSLETIAGVQLLSARYVRIDGAHRALKRLVDVAGAGVLLVLLAPVMIVVAALIRLTSKGPALYIQERVGQGGKVFKMLKFRTMRVDAESTTGPVWATEDDPRRTPIGAFLRRTSLDETPQLINVLLGDMSLVGPRPERPHFVEQFRKEIPRYDERHAVKGGITGWAQVHGLRGNSSIEERTKYDLYYVENWSLELDLEILVKTAFEVLFHRQAY